MNRILKYPLNITDKQTIKIPLQHGMSLKDSVLKIDIQREYPFMWVMAEDENEPIECEIFTKGTGHTCDSIFTRVDTYLGSYQLQGGGFVGHVFGFKDERKYK